MTKNMYIAVFFLLLLFAGCGFFIFSIQRDEIEKDAEMFLIQNRLQRVVSYEKTAMSLSDVFIMRGVGINNKPFFDFPNKINELKIRSFRKKGNGIVLSLSVLAQGVSFDVLQAAKSYAASDNALAEKLTAFSPVSDAFFRPLEFMLLAGCDTVNADVAFDLFYSPVSSQLQAVIGISDVCLGKSRLSVIFDDITVAKEKKLISAARNLATGRDFIPEIQEFLKGTTFINADFSYEEAKLIKGYKRYLDSLYLRLPDASGQTEPDSYQIQALSSYLSFFSIHKQRNFEIARALANFFKEPQNLKISTKAGKKVPLDNLKGDIHRRILDLLLKADVTVTANKKN